MKKKVLKTPAERTASAKYSSSCVRSDIEGLCAYGCGTTFTGRKTKKYCSEGCKQKAKRAKKKYS